MAAQPGDGHKVGSKLDVRRLVRSRGFNVVATLMVLGAIVWGVRNAAPRIEPMPQASVDPARTETAAAEAGKPEAAKSDPPAADAGKAESSPGEAPKTEPQKAEAGQPELPKTQPAKPEAPKTEAAQAEPQQEPAPKPVTATLPSFQDSRPVITPSAKEQPAATAAPAAATPSLSFKDERPLAGGQAGEAAKPAGPLFTDARPLAAPSFRDMRPVTTPSFRDMRPIGPAPAETPPASAAAAPASPTTVPAATPTAPVTQPQAPAAAAPVRTTAPEAAPPAGQTSGGGTSTLVALSPSTIRLDAGACGQPEVTTEALDGGLMRIRIAGGCRPSEAVQISYGGAEMIRRLDAFGALDFNLDCFAGTGSAVELRFADGSRKTLPVIANDLERVSKVAVVWRAAVNLDLHVFEYGAAFEAPGHLWAKNPGSQGAVRVVAQAERRGHGFLSSTDSEQTLGDKVEVYTFYHNDEQASGAIALALDYETRGETPNGATCGTGALAEVDFQVVILPRKGQAARQSGVLTRVACGTRISQEARYNQSALPGLRIRR